MSEDHRTTCCQRVGTHPEGSQWAGHPLICCHPSEGRHPGNPERCDGICRTHLAMYEVEPFAWTDVVPIGRPHVTWGGGER